LIVLLFYCSIVLLFNCVFFMEGNKKYLQLSDIEAYFVSFSLSNYVWSVIVYWDYFSKDTVGKQFVKAVDSISANIAEGFGRYNKKDKIHFYHYSYGSIKESLDWNQKAKVRKLLTEAQYDYIYTELDKLPKLTRQLILYTDLHLKH